METINDAAIEAVTLSDILNLATWDRQRSDEELKSFIETRHAQNNEVIDF